MKGSVRVGAAMCAAALVLGGVQSSASAAEPDRPSGREARADSRVATTWHLTGHGYGHGHGLSQYGAQRAASQGLAYPAILKFYYPGTSWGHMRGNVRVLISSDYTSDVQVGAKKGLTIRNLKTHRAWRLPSRPGRNRWRMTPAANGTTAVQFRKAGRWHRWRVPNATGTIKRDGQFAAPGPLKLFVPGGDGLTPRRYRGVIRSVKPSRGSSSRDTVNVVNMDQYVRGVVPYEMPTSWNQEALRAQAVAARSFGAWQRSLTRSNYYQICDTVTCQVYGGVEAEVAASNRAVEATAGRILTYGGKPASTQFSSSSGGWTSYGGLRYLPERRDPYDDYSGNPNHTWKQGVSSASIASAYPSIGRLTSMKITKRSGNGAWGGRVETIRLQGSQGSVRISGDDFRFHYGLRSNWFIVGKGR